MKRMGWILVAIVIALGLAATRVYRARQLNNAPTLQPLLPTVVVAPVRRERVVRTRHVLGRVLGADETRIAPRVMAQILDVKVREGDRVERGRLLVSLDSRELQDGLAQAEAGLQSARETLSAARIGADVQADVTARDKRLFEAKAIAQEQWDRSRAAQAAADARLEAAKAQVEVAAKQLEQARTRLSYTELRAPFNGVVAERLADPGDLAAPGRPLLRLVRQSGVRVRAEVPPEDFPLLHAGQSIDLSLAGEVHEARISRVFPAMGESHLAAFEADIAHPPPGFVSGATVGVDVHLLDAEGLSVPADALLEGAKGSYVFVVRADTVEVVRVEVSDRSSERVLVTGDLREGDSVVTARPSRLMTMVQGMKVRTAAE
jgi:RND family efflux transporter MFP subunit